MHCLVAMKEKWKIKIIINEAKKLLTFQLSREERKLIKSLICSFAHGSAESQFHLIDGWLLLSKILSGS